MQRRIVLIFILILMGVTFGWAQIPQKISFQGILTDESGNVLNGDQTLIMKLYEAETGGDPIWLETQVIPVNEGVFNIVLGNVTTLDVPFDGAYWIGITVGVGGSELIPRVQLTSAPYSLNAFTVIDGAISTEKIQDEAVTQSKLAPDVVLPPGGAAGGDLTGNYPNPTITENAVNSGKIADGEVGTDDLADGAVTQAKIGGGITLPPSGAAGGDLSGTYPNPSVVKIRVGNVSSNVPNPGEVLQWNGSVWEPSSPPGGPPSGSAGGDLTGTYPNPTIATNAVTLNKLQPNVLSSVEGVINDGGGIDLIEGDNIEIIANDAANTITISATSAGDITEVTAGNGLTGGGTSNGVSLDVGSGDGISVSADAISLNTTYTDGLYVNEGQVNSISAGMITPTIISGIDGVENDAGNIDLVEGSNITITPNNAANTITIAASGVGDITDVTAGNGLTGGGTTDGVTLHVGSGNGINVSADAVSLNTTYTDGLYVNEGQVNSVTAGMITPTIISGIDGVENDAGNIDLVEGSNITITPNNSANTITIAASGVGDITDVTAGNGLTGGGTTDGVTLHVGSGNGINVSADAVSLNTTYTDGLYVNEGQVNSVTSGMIQDSEVTTADLENSSVTVQKISSLGADNDQVIMYDGQTVNWRSLPTRIAGSGTTNRVAKFTSSTYIGNSLIFDNGTSVGIGTTTPGYLLDVRSTAGTAIYALSSLGHGVVGQTAGTTSSYYGVLGQAGGSAFGVYGYQSSTTGGYAVAARNEGGGIAVYGFNNGSGIGAQGYSIGSNGVVGITGRTDNNYGLYSNDNLYALNFYTIGSIIQVAKNGGTETLEKGDVVAIAGIESGQFGKADKIIKVKKSEQAGSTGIIGVVAGTYSPLWFETEEDIFGGSSPKTDIPISSAGPIAPGEYMLIVVQGPAEVKVDAAAGIVQAGDLLSSSDRAGFAGKSLSMEIQGLSTPLPGTVIGKALEPVNPGKSGLIYVYVTLQ